MSRWPDPTTAAGATTVNVPGAFSMRSPANLTDGRYPASPANNAQSQKLQQSRTPGPQTPPPRAQGSPMHQDIIRTRSRKKSNPNYLMYIPPKPEGGVSSPSHQDYVHNHRHQKQASDASQRSYMTARQLSGNDSRSASTRDTSASTGINPNSCNTPITASDTSKPSSYCATCRKPITTKSVKALGKRYHTQCFGCSDCGTPILSKYFPFETEDGKKIPLCEEHFYKRRGLVCCVCDDFLKGTHYTVFGRKYDSEHFCCKICSKKFDTDEDFFNHDDNIYCHYHFSKFFIERCEGCEFAILKQYVEIFRGGRNQKWHVECYMIHKCWNVAIAPTTIGLPMFPRVEPTEANLKSLLDINPTPDELIAMESRASDKVSDIWTTLFKFEEDTATCISDMLLFATAHDQRKGLTATARLVLKIDALFKSIESLHRLGIDAVDSVGTLSNLSLANNEDVTFQTLKKEPRNLSAKIMIYLAILRKTSKGASDSGNSQDLILSVVTGLAHYLKLLIRYGLHNSLQYNKTSHTTSALDKFLREVRSHESVPLDALDSLDVPVDASDLCFHCQKSIESECVQHQDKRWHIDCLHCTKCHKNLQTYGGVADASFNSHSNWVLCAQCAMDDPNAKSGFRSVSRLLQLSYLLKIAIVRSKAVMEYEVTQKSSQRNAELQRSSLTNEQGYMKTLNDIKRLRSTRQNTRITENVSRDVARRSVIIESTDNTFEGRGSQQDTKFLSDDVISKQRITVEDEPVGPSLSKKSFNRATTFMNNQKVLTLDDIPRIVAAEHARELRPNTYKFHNPHQDEGISKGIRPKSNSVRNGAPSVQSGAAEKEPPSKYYSQLTDEERYIIGHISATLLRDFTRKLNIHTEIDINTLLDIKKNPTFWTKLKGLGNNEKKSLVLSKVFGSDLKDLTAKTGVESGQSGGPSKVRIPMVIDDLLTALYQKDMSVEGVFRKNGNLKTLRELVEKIDSNPTKIPDLEKENTIQLSALLKKFLRELPNPLLTFRLYDVWILSQKVMDENQKRILTELCYSMLPKVHRDLTEVLLFFFMWASSFSHLDEQSGSKMDVHNLATVLSPNVLYNKPTEVTRPVNAKGNVAATYYDAFGENEGENYYLAIEVMDYLISHNEELSLVPTYLLDILAGCKFERGEQYTSKEIFAKVESFLKQNPELFNSIGKYDAAGSQMSDNAVVEEAQLPVATTIN